MSALSAMRRGWQGLARWWVKWVTAPPAESGWAARQIRRNSEQIATLREEVAVLKTQATAAEAALAQQQALRASGIEGVRRALTAAGVRPPECVTADAATQPILRVVV